MNFTVLNKAKSGIFLFITISLLLVITLKYGNAQPSDNSHLTLTNRTVSLSYEHETICVVLCEIAVQTGCKLKLDNVSGHMRGYTFSIKCDKIPVKDLLDVLFSKNLIRYYVIDADTLHTEVSTIVSP
jgi:hypothetical protein